MECVVQRQITLRDKGGTSAEQLSDLFYPFHCTLIAQKPLWDRGAVTWQRLKRRGKGVSGLSSVKNTEWEEPKPRLAKFPGCAHDVIR